MAHFILFSSSSTSTLNLTAHPTVTWLWNLTAHLTVLLHLVAKSAFVSYFSPFSLRLPLTSSWRVPWTALGSVFPSLLALRDWSCRGRVSRRHCIPGSLYVDARPPYGDACKGKKWYWLSHSVFVSSIVTFPKGLLHPKQVRTPSVKGLRFTV